MTRKYIKKKRIIWYKLVACALEAQKTFSILSNNHKAKYIYQEIAYYLLEQKHPDDETERHKQFNYYCRKVRGAIDKAILYLESENVVVYKHANEGGNRILYVTIDKTQMPKAQEHDFDRVEIRVKQTIEAAKTHIQLAHPRLENRFNKSTQKLLIGEIK